MPAPKRIVEGLTLDGLLEHSVADDTSYVDIQLTHHV